MGRYVGNKWHEELPSLSEADQVQGNNEPVSAPAPSAPANNTFTAPSSGGTLAFDPQGSTAALLAAGYLDTPAGRQSFFNDTGGTSYPKFDSNGRVVSGNGGGPITVQSNTNSSANALAALGKQIQAMLEALGKGNTVAAQEAAREFDANFGLDQQKFQESVRQYNQNFSLQQAGITGTYNGQDTLAKQAQDFQEAVTAAGLTGMYNGQQTQQAQQQQFQQGLARAQLGLQAAQAVGSLQNDPFQQAKVMYGAGGLLKGILGGNLPSFQAPTGSAQNTGARGMAGGVLNWINGGNWMGQGQGQGAGAGTSGYNPAAFSPPGAGGATGPAGTMGEFSNLKSPNDVVARTYIAAPLSTQNMITSAIADQTGLTQADVDSQIKASLPKFTAPSFGLASV